MWWYRLQKHKNKSFHIFWTPLYICTYVMFVLWAQILCSRSERKKTNRFNNSMKYTYDRIVFVLCQEIRACHCDDDDDDDDDSNNDNTSLHVNKYWCKQYYVLWRYIFISVGYIAFKYKRKWVRSKKKKERIKACIEVRAFATL